VKTLTLSKREELILCSIVERHVRTAKPVSSNAVVRAGRVHLSSATVRNVMRSLEEKGLISQPHTSAGRVPTDRGYRYYVDRLMEPSFPSDAERAAIEGQLAGLADLDPGTAAAAISRMVSSLTRELAVSIAPAPAGVVERLDIVELGGNRVVVVAATRSGATRSAALELERPIAARELAETAKRLNEWLSGVSLGEAETVLRARIGSVDRPVRNVLSALLASGSKLFGSGEAGHVHHEGARYIFRHPEFASDAACLGEILDSERALAELVLACEPSGVTITIGRENPRREMRRMALVVSAYRAGGSVGRMGVIGPMRMRYSRLVGLLDYFSGALSELFATGTWERDDRRA